MIEDEKVSLGEVTITELEQPPRVGQERGTGLRERYPPGGAVQKPHAEAT